jgi:GGDEF domain-containing protein
MLKWNNFFCRVRLSWQDTARATPYWYPSADPARSVNANLERKLQDIEAALLLFCGVYGLLVTAVIFQWLLGPTLICTAFVAIGLWRWRYPARSKLARVLDMIACLCLLSALFFDPRLGASAGPYLFLVLLFAMAFPMMLELGDAALFSLLLLAIYVCAGRAGQALQLSGVFGLRTFLVLGICSLSVFFGQRLRHIFGKTELLRLDLQSGAYNEHGWLHYGERLLKECRLAGEALSIALIPMPSLWQEQLVAEYGLMNAQPQRLHQLKENALKGMATGFSTALSPRSLVGRDSHGHWVLIAPDTARQELLQRLEKRFGRPLQVEFGPVELEMFVGLQACVVECQAQESIMTAYARAIDIWGRARRTGVAEV